MRLWRRLYARQADWRHETDARCVRPGAAGPHRPVEVPWSLHARDRAGHALCDRPSRALTGALLSPSALIVLRRPIGSGAWTEDLKTLADPHHRPAIHRQ